MYSREVLVSDFAPFCDIGEALPKVSQDKGSTNIKLVRDGEQLKISIDNETGRVIAAVGTRPKKSYSSLSGLLASELFANLKRWSDAQKELLKRDATKEKELLPINCTMHSGEQYFSIEEVSANLGTKQRPENATEILLVDGPAGVGKTNLIEQLTLARASTYKDAQQALILHVKSRGRVLSNLQDLMAFSLQTIRSPITYDQIPILAKYGLVIIAIDGFDELGDPNGYEMAWAQLGELVNQVRGCGTLILAGRDTFLGRARLIRDVESIKPDVDVVNSLTLKPPTGVQAKDWLKTHRWTVAQIENPAISDLLEDGSFALRPVFLRLLGKEIKPRLLLEKREAYITSMLIDSMISRESKLFGKAVDALLTGEQLESFIFTLMTEVAREMADSQSETLDASALSWIAEVALGDDIDSEVMALIRNRASVIAFLIPDERPGYLTFMHSQVMNYFLSNVTIDALSVGDTPKFIRRSLLGPDYLSSFIDVCSQVGSAQPERMEAFLHKTVNFSYAYSGLDRGVRNVGALVLAALPYATLKEAVSFRNYDIDDAVARGTYPAFSAENVTISQLDCRGADFRLAEFNNVAITSLIADDASRFSPTFPIPAIITDGDGRQVDDNDVIAWLEARGRNNDDLSLDGIISAALRKHPIYSLLGRACRLRQYWLRLEDDQHAERILRDPHWDKLSALLEKHDFLRKEVRAASGRSPTFYHIKHRDRILAENADDASVVSFYQELAAII